MGFSFLALGTALVFQHVFSIQPCKLCIYERWPYVLVVIAGFSTMLAKRSSWLLATSYFLIFLSLLTNVGLSGYHIAVENQWISLPKTCSGALKTGGDLQSLKSLILNTQYAPCDKVPFKILGLSLTAYNLIYTLFLLLLAGIGLGKARKLSAKQDLL